MRRVPRTQYNCHGRIICCLLAAFFLAIPSKSADSAQSVDFHACLAQLQEVAIQQGISAEMFDRATAQIVPDMRVIERLDRQPEAILSFTDYLQRQVTEGRIRTGRAKMVEYHQLLSEIEARYGVDPAILVAIWGMESSFGAAAGNFPVVQSLATLSCYGRRQPFFRNEFYSALRILEHGDVTEQNFLGSWAGAFGQTQFLPSTFERLAVDHTGDGRRNIIGSVSDALASAANYLKHAGWQPGMPWGFEVITPNRLETSDIDWRGHKPLGYWQAQGVTRPDGLLITEHLSETVNAGLLMTEQSGGTHFLVLTNFNALYHYNPAVNYALAIAHLAERLRE